MKMCFNVCDVSFAFNALCLFLFVIYSTLLLSDNVHSQSIILPAKTEALEEIILLPSQSEGHVRRRKLREPDRSAMKKYPVWFGPRQGRKKRSTSTDDEILGMFDEHSYDQDLQLQGNYPWTLIFNDAYSKRQFMKPRIGRGNTWLEDEEKIIKTPPLSPKVSRRSLIPLKPRLGRAGSNPETIIFKPRLGRDPGFSNELSEYTGNRNYVDDKDH